jgi:hypothetical protein
LGGPAAWALDAAVNWDDYQGARQKFNDEAQAAIERLLLLRELGIDQQIDDDIDLPSE